MLNSSIIIIGKSLSRIIKLFNLGNGSTWPGHIALFFNKNFIKDIVQNSRLRVVIVAGTNGKTTSAGLITHILKTDGKKVLQNTSGANLLNGIASSILLRADIFGRLAYDFAVFEVDENLLPLVLEQINPDYLLLLNIFRDQLDRYGETTAIADKWKSALSKLSEKTMFILNADDPQIAWLGLSSWSEAIGSTKKDFISLSGFQNDKIKYFGLNDKKLHQKLPQRAADTLHCLNCSERLIYDVVYFSHLGQWRCPNCGFQRPKNSVTKSSFYPLLGVYNYYNTNAAGALARTLNIDNNVINNALHSFKPAFGRQEKMEKNGKKVQFFLSKNPTSFNESLRTICEVKARTLLIILNDRIPDGKDISWIWDIDIEGLINSNMQIFISGDRAFDMGLRIEYSCSEFKKLKFKIEDKLKNALSLALNSTKKNETLYIFPTYSAMLEARKIITGREIL